MKEPIKCPKAILGDIQLETVLTPLLFPYTKPLNGQIWKCSPDDTRPDLKILDIGCGGGRLLAGMTSFPKHILKHIDYSGCEPTTEDIENTKIKIKELENILLEKIPFSDLLSKITLGTWKDFKDMEGEFNFVYMINVLHHIPPEDFPIIFANISRLIKDHGYLIIHDFYFADLNTAYDLSKYCDKSIFFGPNHVSSFFTMAATQTGIYRTMRRYSRDGKAYDLYTFVLHFDNVLSREAYEKSVWYDDYFSYYEIPRGLDLSLINIIESYKNMPQKDWFEPYVIHANLCRKALHARWKNQIEMLDDFDLHFERWIKS